MATLREFEVEAIRIMGEGVLTANQLSALKDFSGPAQYEYTGSGYFLTVTDPALPEQRSTLSSPAVVGEVGEVMCGFVVFLGEHQLTLECHTWGPVDVPEGFRQLAVRISTPPVNVVDLR